MLLLPRSHLHFNHIVWPIQTFKSVVLLIYSLPSLLLLMLLSLLPSSTITSSSVRTFYASGMVNAYHVIGKSHGVWVLLLLYIFILLFSSHLFTSFAESQFSMPSLYNNNKFSPTLIGEEIFKCLKFNQFSCEVELFGKKKRIWLMCKCIEWSKKKTCFEIYQWKYIYAGILLCNCWCCFYYYYCCCCWYCYWLFAIIFFFDVHIHFTSIFFVSA